MSYDVDFPITAPHFVLRLSLALPGPTRYSPATNSRVALPATGNMTVLNSDG